MLTGKCKEAFEGWYNNSKNPFCFPYDDFIELDFQMQYGVYLEFFDSVEMQIYTKPTSKNVWSVYIDNYGHHIFTEYLEKETRQESQIEAIKKANYIFNAR